MTCRSIVENGLHAVAGGGSCIREVACSRGEDVQQLRKLLQSVEKEKNRAGSIHEKGNLGEQEDMGDKGKTMKESSQVNQETVWDSLVVFRANEQNI